MKIKLTGVVLFTVTFFLLTGCSINQEEFDKVTKRIEELKAQGIPEEMLASAEVELYNATSANKRRSVGAAKEALKKTRMHIDEAEQQFRKEMSETKPSILAKIQELSNKTASLTGEHKKHYDSLLGVIHSSLDSNRFVEAQNATDNLEKYVPTLLADQELSQTIMKKLPGKYVGTQKKVNGEKNQYKSLRTTTFQFYKNGRVILTEQKYGQDDAYLKEDWKFVSYGTYGAKGDTIMLYVDRFKRVKETISELDPKTKKWKVDARPPYDSAITDGSQNRDVFYDHLKEDYVYSRK